MVHRTQKRSRRSSSRRRRSYGLNKAASEVKGGVNTLFGFLKSGFGLAYDAAKQGVKKGEKILLSKTRKHRKHRKH